MAKLRSPFLAAIYERGFVQDCTDRDGLDEHLAGAASARAYIGFDCTADSLHVGSLIQIMLLRWWQKTGNQPIVVMGGGTTQIGDPSGKDASRQLLSKDEIARNKASIQRVFERFLDFGGPPAGALMVDNADWLDGLQYIPFLREVGSHFSINRMLTFDSVKLRLEREQPLTFLEFNYMILQAYDFLELRRRHHCILQMGGSDQWGNIVSGIELARRMGHPDLFGLTSPLLTTASGVKMGKTAEGAVWLNADRLPPYGYWQFWRNTEDADVGRFLRLFTDIDLPEIARLAALGGAEVNEAKKVLATAATTLAHGEAAALQAAETARTTFEAGGAADTLPTHLVAAAALEAGLPVFRLLADSGLAASLGEARRLIRGGGARVNDEPVNEDRVVTAADLRNGAVKLSAGRKHHRLVKPE